MDDVASVRIPSEVAALEDDDARAGDRDADGRGRTGHTAADDGNVVENPLTVRIEAPDQAAFFRLSFGWQVELVGRVHGDGGRLRAREEGASFENRCRKACPVSRQAALQHEIEEEHAVVADRAQNGDGRGFEQATLDEGVEGDERGNAW